MALLFHTRQALQFGHPDLLQSIAQPPWKFVLVPKGTQLMSVFMHGSRRAKLDDVFDSK